MYIILRPMEIFKIWIKAIVCVYEFQTFRLISALIHMLSLYKHKLNAFLWLILWYLNAYSDYYKNQNYKFYN